MFPELEVFRYSYRMERWWEKESVFCAFNQLLSTIFMAFFFNQALKDSLICTLFQWICQHIEEGHGSQLDFIDQSCVS